MKGLPRTDEEIAAVAKAQGFVIPAACMPGVAASLAVLRIHAEALLAPKAGATS